MGTLYVVPGDVVCLEADLRVSLLRLMYVGENT